MSFSKKKKPANFGPFHWWLSLDARARGLYSFLAISLSSFSLLPFFFLNFFNFQFSRERAREREKWLLLIHGVVMKTSLSTLAGRSLFLGALATKRPETVVDDGLGLVLFFLFGTMTSLDVL